MPMLADTASLHPNMGQTEDDDGCIKSESKPVRDGLEVVPIIKPLCN